MAPRTTNTRNDDDCNYAGDDAERLASMIESVLHDYGSGDNRREAREAIFFEGELRLILQALRR